MPRIARKVAATIIQDDSERAMEWIRLWQEIKRMEGLVCTYEESCNAWFEMQRNQVPRIEKEYEAHA